MNTFLAAFETVTILLTIGLLGFILISRGILAREVLQSLSRLALEIALPCLIFYNIILNFTPYERPGWWKLPVAFIVFVMASGTLSLLSSLLVRTAIRREFSMSLFYPNAVFVPLIIMAEFFGYDSPRLVDLFFFTVLFSPFYFGTYPLFFSIGRHGVRIPWTKILNPVFLTSLTAIAVCFAGLQDAVPDFLLAAARLVGNMSAPLLLIVLGGTIYLDLHAGGVPRKRDIALFVILKNVVFPAVALVLLVLFRPPPQIALLLLLEAAVPPITSLPILVGREGGNRPLVCRLLVASFAASLLTIPAALTLFRTFFGPFR